MTLIVLLAFGGVFFILVAVTVAAIITLLAKRSSPGLGSKYAHPEVVACPQCGFVAPRGKVQCPSCGCKVGEFAGG
jgi:hypothetical protein